MSTSHRKPKRMRTNVLARGLAALGSILIAAVFWFGVIDTAPAEGARNGPLTDVSHLDIRADVASEPIDPQFPLDAIAADSPTT